jgi:hypothetical protein
MEQKPYQFTTNLETSTITIYVFGRFLWNFTVLSQFDSNKHKFQLKTDGRWKKTAKNYFLSDLFLGTKSINLFAKILLKQNSIAYIYILTISSTSRLYFLVKWVIAYVWEQFHINLPILKQMFCTSKSLSNWIKTLTIHNYYKY